MDKRIPPTNREQCPCFECPERFTACSDRCPKDERGGYGFKAWKARVKEIEDNRKAYYDERRRRNGK